MQSVKLNKNDTTTIINENFDSSNITGDGPSALFYELVQTNESGSNNYVNLKHDATWGSSNIRWMLNGSSSSSSSYKDGNCLLATFPEELQNAIGTRAVKYRAYAKLESYGVRTTYDKLWLLATNEVFANPSSVYAAADEGSLYQRENSTPSQMPYFASSSADEYYGLMYGTWLRTGGTVFTGFGIYIYSSDNMTIMQYADVAERNGDGYQIGVSPCFTLK